MFASLRSSEDESVIVLINMSGEPVGDYELSIAESPLFNLGSLMGKEALVGSLSINQAGGFNGYKTLDELAPIAPSLFWHIQKTHSPKLLLTVNPVVK